MPTVAEVLNRLQAPPATAEHHYTGTVTAVTSGVVTIELDPGGEDSECDALALAALPVVGARVIVLSCPAGLFVLGTILGATA